MSFDDDVIEDVEEIEIHVMSKPLPPGKRERIMERVTREIEEAYCGPEFADDDDHDCSLYVISWKPVRIDGEGRTADEAELDAYRERFGPIDKLTAERFSPVDERHTAEKISAFNERLRRR